MVSTFKMLSLKEEIKKLIAFLGPKVVRLLLLGIISGLVVSFVELAFAYGLQTFLVSIGVMDAKLIQIPTWIPHANELQVVLFLLFVGLFRAFLQWAQVYMGGATLEQFKYDLRTRILKWAFHSQSVGFTEVSILFNEKTNTTANVLANIQSLLIYTTSSIILCISLFVLAPKLTLVAGAILLLIAFPIRFADKKIRIAGDKVNNNWEKTNRKLMNSIKNLLLLQIYGTNTSEERQARKSLDIYKQNSIRYYLLTGFKLIAPQVFGISLICLIALTATSWFSLASSVLVSYFYLFVRFVQSLSSMSQLISSAVFYRKSLGEVKHWWETNSNSDSYTSDTLLDSDEELLVDGPVGWQLAGVSFGYPLVTNGFSKLDSIDHGKLVIDSISTTIHPGKAFVIIGPSGAGKSTLLNLLLGILQPQQGLIAVLDNQSQQFPLTKVRSSLLKKVGYVGAESFLIEGSIYENLIYGLQQIPSKNEIFTALTQAECGFVFELDRGLEHFLTEQGLGLSAGQKQRLSLARALLRKPKVLILDEATANLDQETEAKLVATLAQLKKQMTLVAVTHRKELLKIADQTLELNLSNQLDAVAQKKLQDYTALEPSL